MGAHLPPSLGTVKAPPHPWGPTGSAEPKEQVSTGPHLGTEAQPVRQSRGSRAEGSRHESSSDLQQQLGAPTSSPSTQR